MTEELRLILAMLVVYRLSSLITQEEGPYLGLWKPVGMGLFEWIRMQLGAFEYGENGEPQTNLGRGISCPLCVGLYLSVIGMFFVILPSTLGDVILIALGIAGGQVFLESLLKRHRDN